MPTWFELAKRRQFWVAPCHRMHGIVLFFGERPILSRWGMDGEDSITLKSCLSHAREHSSLSHETRALGCGYILDNVCPAIS